LEGVLDENHVCCLIFKWPEVRRCAIIVGSEHTEKVTFLCDQEPLGCACVGWRDNVLPFSALVLELAGVAAHVRGHASPVRLCQFPVLFFFFHAWLKQLLTARPNRLC
jgi:hypothetical protein